MAIAAESAASAAETRTSLSQTRRRSPLSCPTDTSPRDAAACPPTAEEEDERVDAHVGDKRERSNEVAIQNRSAATSGSGRHVLDNPHEGAKNHAQPRHALCASLLSALHTRIRLTFSTVPDRRCSKTARWSRGGSSAEGPALALLYRRHLPPARRARDPRQAHRRAPRGRIRCRKSCRSRCAR